MSLQWWVTKGVRGKRFLHMRHAGEPKFGPWELARIWSAVVWPGSRPGYVLTGCQASRGGRVYLLNELESRDWRELARRLAQDKRALGSDMAFQEGGALGAAYRDRVGQLDLEEKLTGWEGQGGQVGLALDAAPYQDLPGFAVGLARDWVKPERLTIMPELKRLTGQLKELAPLGPQEVVDRLPELHAYRALVFLLSAFDAYPLEPDRAMTAPAWQPADPMTGI